MLALNVVYSTWIERQPGPEHAAEKRYPSVDHPLCTLCAQQGFDEDHGCGSAQPAQGCYTPQKCRQNPESYWWARLGLTPAWMQLQGANPPVTMPGKMYFFSESAQSRTTHNSDLIDANHLANESQSGQLCARRLPDQKHQLWVAFER